MAGDGTFTQLARSFAEIGRECARIEAGADASEALIASAEYELEQIKKVLAGASFDAEPAVEGEPVSWSSRRRGRARRCRSSRSCASGSLGKNRNSPLCSD